MKVRFSLKALFALLTCSAIFCCAIVALITVFGIGGEERVFANVRIGDTEKRLIQLLDANRVDYHSQVEGDQTVYVHSDGFLGICVYYVVNGRVVNFVQD